MKILELDEIIDHDRYAGLRPAYRSAVIAYKRSRRVAVGENITLVFENRETIRFQVQEMMWVEGIRGANKIQHELDTYNELIPTWGGLSATLFVDITDGEAIRATLERLVGIDESVSLILGADGEQVVPARFDSKQMEEDRLSAVQYIQFHLDREQRERFCNPEQPARIRIDHPNYQRVVEIEPATRAGLIADLTVELNCLLPDFDPSVPARTSEILFETANVRALRPVRPLAPGHVIVEPIAPVPSLLDASPDLLAELMAGVQRAARDIVQELGTCRVQTELGSDSAPLCWHLYAAPK
jgi:hypothetical protein